MTQVKQQNIYTVYDSMGRRTEIHIMASNIKEAYAKCKQPEYKTKINSQFYTLKRSYNGGVMGQK